MEDIEQIYVTLRIQRGVFVLSIHGNDILNSIRRSERNNKLDILIECIKIKDMEILNRIKKEIKRDSYFVESQIINL